MKGILKKGRDPFALELTTQGDMWRILRKSTLVDLIKLSFYYFQKDKNEIHLIEIFNLSMIITVRLKFNTSAHLY